MGRIAALAIALLFAGAAHAAEDGVTYIYGAVGAVRTDPGFDQTANDAALQAAGATDVASKLDRWDAGWKIMVGWMPNRYVGLEGGFAALGTATYMAQFTGGQAKSQFKTGGIIFDILALAPVSDSVSLFAKAGGIAASVVTTQSVTPPGGVESASRTDARMFAPNFGAGAIWDFTKSVSLRFEAERYSHVGNDAIGRSNIDMISLGLLLKL